MPSWAQQSCVAADHSCLLTPIKSNCRAGGHGEGWAGQLCALDLIQWSGEHDKCPACAPAALLCPPNTNKTLTNKTKLTPKHFTLPEILKTEDLLYFHLPLSSLPLVARNGDDGSLVNKPSCKAQQCPALNLSSTCNLVHSGFKLKGIRSILRVSSQHVFQELLDPLRHGSPALLRDVQLHLWVF